MKRRSGQVLVLVLLMVVVALSVGLSVASRNITNLKTATQTERSQKAFGAAEGGVEDVLSRLGDIASDPDKQGQLGSTAGLNEQVPVGNITANVNVKASSDFRTTIELGNVGQVQLNGATAGQVRIQWAKASDPTESASPASIIVTEYVLSSGVYTQNRDAFAGVSGRANETGFSPAPAGCTPEFVRCETINITGDSTYLRIRPLWSKTSVSVTGVGGQIPVQTYSLESTAQTEEGIARRVKVTRNALPALPAAFDYALYATEDINK